MRVLLTALNARFIHSNLAIRYLAASVRDCCEPEVREFTINDRPLSITGEIFAAAPEMVGFSCYIWNIEMTLAVIQTLKQVLPGVTVVCGGPEVSFGAADLLQDQVGIDYIVRGEGEATFRELLLGLREGPGDLSGIAGLAYRQSGAIRVNPPRVAMPDLDWIPSPYLAGAAEYQNKIVYYESSRGCPYHCSFCLSSLDRGVRRFSLERVKQDLAALLRAGVRQVKFVDRTFNCDREWAMAIWEFLLDHYRENTNFHFELAAHLLDAPTVAWLQNVPAGYFQFEIGVQSTNPRTLAAINRQTDWERLSAAVRGLRAAGRIHLHLDLIAGLPYEDYASFGRSFDAVFALQPQMLQLGFLKVLRGSPLDRNKEEYGYLVQKQPPYEVLGNNYLSFGELLRLKQIETLVEAYVNSGRFNHSLAWVIGRHYRSAFAFLEALADYWQEKGYFNRGIGDRESYRILADFGSAAGWGDPGRDYLKLDLLLRERCPVLPDWCRPEEHAWTREQALAFLGQPANLDRYLPRLRSMAPKEIIRQVQFAAFGHAVWPGGDGRREPQMLLFDYSSGGRSGQAVVTRVDLAAS